MLDDSYSPSEHQADIWRLYPAIMSRYPNVQTLHLQVYASRFWAYPRSVLSLIGTYEHVTITLFYTGRTHDAHDGNMIQLEGLDLSRVTMISTRVSDVNGLVRLQEYTLVGLRIQNLMVVYRPTLDFRVAWSNLHIFGLKALNMIVQGDDESDTLGIVDFLSRHPSLESIVMKFSKPKEFNSFLTQRLYEPGADRTCTLNIRRVELVRRAGNSLPVPAYRCRQLVLKSDCSDLDGFASVVSRVAKCYPEMEDLRVQAPLWNPTSTDIVPVSSFWTSSFSLNIMLIQSF